MTQPIASWPDREIAKWLGDSQILVSLEGESPAGMCETVLHSEPGVSFPVRAVHRLQEEVVESEGVELFRHRSGLGVDQLELVALAHHDVRARLRTHADPVDARCERRRAIGLDGD